MGGVKGSGKEAVQPRQVSPQDLGMTTGSGHADIKIGANRTITRVVLDVTAPSGHRVVIELGLAEVEGLILGLKQAQRIVLLPLSLQDADDESSGAAYYDYR